MIGLIIKIAAQISNLWIKLELIGQRRDGIQVIQKSFIVVIMILLGAIGIGGCTRTGESQSTKTSPSAPKVKLTVAYSFDGKGTRAKFTKDPSLLVAVVRVGRNTSTAIGMTTKGRCAKISTYSPAEIKFENGQTKTFASVTLEGWLNDPPALVEVP